MVAPGDDDTIDGVEKDTAPPPPIVAKSGPLADYPGLVSVERSHYDFGDTIAQGGMGRISKARDRRLGRRVAIKEMLPATRDAARRFEREARITARLQHPAIVHVYEAGRWTGGEPFYAMNHVDGEPMSEVIKQRPDLDDRLALLPNVIAVAEALAYAHNENVIHRDLKPANIVIGAFGETVVIDWGVAKDLGAPLDPQESLVMRRVGPDETSEGGVLGTAAYMPPEQARGEAVDRRADVYALGALLYHVITQHGPYAGVRGLSKIDQVKAGPCTPVEHLQPATPVDLVTIVHKAMARDPDERYRDAGEVVDELRAFQAGQLIAARNDTRWELFRRWLAKHRVVVGIATAAVVVLAVVGAVSIERILHEKRKEELALALSETRRNTLLEERGRSELLAGQAGRALMYLTEAAKDGVRGGARGLLLADALRPFEAQVLDVKASGEPDTVAFSSDGRVFALDGDTIRVFDGANKVFGTTTTKPSQVLVSRARVVTVEGATVRVWSATGGLERELVGHTAEILDAHLSADGRSLATGSADGTARVWDLDSAKVAIARCGKRLPVTAVRLSPDGNKVVSATDDNVICYWDATNGSQFSLLRGHRGRIHSIRWSPDPTRSLVLTASEDGTALLWNPFDGKPVIQPISHDGRAIVSAEFSSDGRRIVTAGADQLARLWELPDDLPVDDPSRRAKELRRFAGHSSTLTTAVFDSRDERIATAGVDNKAKVWDVATGELLATFEHADVVTTVAFSPDGGRLLTASSDRTARLWDLGGAARRPFEVDAVVEAIAVSREGDVAVARADSRISVWRVGTVTPEILRDHTARVFAIAYSPDAKLLASGGEDAAVRVFDAHTHAKLQSLGGHERAIRSIGFSADGRELVTAGEEGIVRVWDLASGSIARTLQHSAPVIQLALARDGTLAVVDEDGRVLMARPSSAILAVQPPLTNGRTRAIAFSDDGSHFVAGARTPGSTPWRVVRSRASPSSSTAPPARFARSPSPAMRRA